MEVRDGFAGVGSVIDHETEAAGQLEFFGDRAGGEEEVAEDGLLVGGGVADAGDDGFRDDQEVDWSLGCDVMDDDAAIVLVFDLRGDFTVDDALEEGLGHTKSSE